MFKNTILALGLTAISTAAMAMQEVEYEVTITNITPGQTFTPQLVVTHSGEARLFSLGEPASESLEILAEGGQTGPLAADVAPYTTEAQTLPDLLEPGQTVTTVIQGQKRGGYLSLAAMMIPTNDNFIAINRMPLPSKQQGSVTVRVPGYDSGTEVNDQSCQNMPGPRCPTGIGFTPETGEGFVHIGNGFHEMGVEVDAEGFDVLGPQVYDWRNSVAVIEVRRIGK